ncbi:MAG TPA: glycosyltransferase family 1 protein [Sulfuricurvum sp.]|nr:glycosyltransferase family 1 protein [Sulfuricurvum sp.]
MKTLFITSRAADYVQDLTYSGLVKLLGVKNVIDLPWNKKFHFPYKKYPKNLGYTAGSLFTSLANRSLKAIELVVVASAKCDVFDTYLSLIDDIPASAVVVFIDGGDQREIGGGLRFEQCEETYKKAIGKRPFDLIFKREYFLEDDWGANVFAFPISFNPDRLRPLSPHKKYDLSFWAVETDPIRTQALELLENAFDCRTNGTQRNQTFRQYKRKGSFYLQELAACKVVLNFRGGGWDTMRYWEVPAVGSMMISQKPGIRIEHDFIEGKHLVYVQDDLSDLLELGAYYITHDTEREAMARAAHEHLLTYHTDEKRAAFLLEQVTKYQRGRS